jgi:hypothetical protein
MQSKADLPADTKTLQTSSSTTDELDAMKDQTNDSLGLFFFIRSKENSLKIIASHSLASILYRYINSFLLSKKNQQLKSVCVGA